MFELAVFGALCFCLAVVGGLAGLVLGNLRLPFAVTASDTVAAGGGANVAISGVAALVAATLHIRAGRVNWRLLAWLAPPSLAGGFIGGVLANAVPGDALLFAISAILFYGAYELFRWRPDGRRGRSVERPAKAGEGAAGDVNRDDASAGAVFELAARDKIAAGLIGLVVGVLGGAVGLILGSLRMPALLRFTHETPQRLVGTNLSAGVLVGVAGTAGHLTGGEAGFDYPLFAVGALASMPGAWIGAHLTGKLSTAALVRAIAIVVSLAAIGMLAKAVS